VRLSLKLPLVYTLLIATLGGAFVGLTSHMVEGAMEGEEEEYFEGLTRFFALNGATAVVLKDYAALSTLVDNMAEAEHVRYVAILDATGRVLAHSDHAQEGRVPDTSLERRAAQATGLLVQRPGENLVDVTAPLTIAGRKWGAARIGFSQDDLRVKIAGAQLLILGIGGGVVLLGALTVLLIARRITGPLGQLHWGAEAFRRGDLGHRVPDRAGDELGDLARAFNDMARDLAAHYWAIEHAKQE